MTTATKAQIPTTPSELKYWTAFHRIPGVGRVRYQALLDRFGSLAEAWSAGPTDLRSAGLDDRVVRAIATERPNIDPDSELDRLEKHGTRALTWNDDAYPALLKEIDDAPPVLYVRGDISAIDEWAVSVVGTRRPTPYGRQVAEEISYQLASHHISVVSGLARGVDAIAHRAAIQAGGRTVAVFACGLDIVYPPEHARLAREIMEHGALISDYPLGTQPRGDYFPRRNRIMSGVSLGVLVVEGDVKSGALITARLALDQNRDVFAIPGSIFSPQSRGTNAIIQKGEAKLVQTVEDVLEELNLTMVPHQIEMQELMPATDTECDLLRHMSKEPVHIDEVCRQSGLPVSTVSSVLAMMELKGLIKQMGPMAYVRTREAGGAHRARAGGAV
ncbi:MAG TPA: DNA-processing protein DprA [Dehalococcoidia bacterium]|nr:DNA-processing protein DprA [Dehalococcoidia bacterium]